jgi:hypothetical protein
MVKLGSKNKNTANFLVFLWYIYDKQTRWYEVLKIMIGNRVEWYNIVGTTKEVPTDFKWYEF